MMNEKAKVTDTTYICLAHAVDTIKNTDKDAGIHD